MSKQKLIKQLRNTKIELTPREIKKMKEEMTLEAVHIVSVLPLLILRDQFGFGEVRLKRYIDSMAVAIQDLNDGRFNLLDISDILEEEVNINVFSEHGSETK